MCESSLGFMVQSAKAKAKLSFLTLIATSTPFLRPHQLSAIIKLALNVYFCQLKTS